MLIKKIKLSNFKCFDEVEVELNDFNVLVGANASGKSNFLQAFKFLKDIQEYGLENAVSLQGGVEYLRNVNLSRETISFSLTFLFSDRKKINSINGYKISEVAYEKKKVVYEIQLEIKTKDTILLSYEKLDIFYEIGEYDITKSDPFSNRKSYINYKVEIKNDDKIHYVVTSGKMTLSDGREINFENTLIDNSLLFIVNYKESDKETFLLNNLNYILDGLFDHLIYDFNPHLSKRATSIASKAELEENGENLAIVLKRILENEDRKRKFINIMRELLPFIKDVGVERFYDKSLLFNIKESFQSNKEIPSSLLSDGTIAITMMIVALFFEKKQLAIFEEPEHGIHPALIAKLMNLFYEASHDKQILITTHNPEVVKHTQLKDLLLISRKENGSSAIARPDHSQAVHAFLNNELGIDELFTQNLLDV